MAKIIGLAQQQAIINKISAGVKDISRTNAFLDTPNESGEFTISFKDATGKKVSSSILCQDRAVIDQLVCDYKQNVANDLAAQAEANRIELDPEEKQVLGL